MIDVRVFGESARELMDVLATIEFEIDDRGMYHAEQDFSAEDGSLLARAVMRAESKLLLEDADILDVGPVWRTPEQRRADAFVQIVTRASSALEAARDSLDERGNRPSTRKSTNCRLHL